jgi:hypothetical protein
MLLEGQIAAVQNDAAADIIKLTTSLQAVVQAILDGYTIEIKAVKK